MAEPHRAWLVKADHDLLNVANNLAAEDVPWDTVCFHAQQAAEKSLKAVLVSYGTAPPRTHDLVALLAQCAEHAPALADLEGACRTLTAFAVSSRYPDDLFEPDEADGRRTAALAREVRARVGLLLRRPGLAGEGGPESGV